MYPHFEALANTLNQVNVAVKLIKSNMSSKSQTFELPYACSMLSARSAGTSNCFMAGTAPENNKQFLKLRATQAHQMQHAVMHCVNALHGDLGWPHSVQTPLKAGAESDFQQAHADAS
eukprot:1123034-Amphidinium_carterae.3